jgi:GTP1/Obg family GTP-binding protein
MSIMKQLPKNGRVKVFDRRLFRDDKKTPLKVTMRRATVIKRYSQVINHRLLTYCDDYGNPAFEEIHWVYEDLVDVVFDHRPNEVSKGHFTSGVDPC